MRPPKVRKLDRSNMSMSLIIIGTGGSALDVLDIVEALNKVAPTWEVAGFLDDAKPAGSRHLGYEVSAPVRDARRFVESYFINVIGSDKTFRRRPEILESTGVTTERFATLVHPMASISTRARLGRGVIVNPGVVIGGGVSIGDHVMLCPGCIIGHESSIGDYSVVAPGAVISGLVEVGTACYVGAGSAVRQKLRVGPGSLVGMGAVVLRDVPGGSCVVGNPARARGLFNADRIDKSYDRPRMNREAFRRRMGSP